MGIKRIRLSRKSNLDHNRLNFVRRSGLHLYFLQQEQETSFFFCPLPRHNGHSTCLLCRPHGPEHCSPGPDSCPCCRSCRPDSWCRAAPSCPCPSSLSCSQRSYPNDE